jgi:predicted regulator of Ras-like GTPase activity (Roadblock/LC7/MglB family)
MTIPPGASLDHQIAAILERLQTSVSGLAAVGLSDANGLPVAFFGPTREKAAAAAMATLLVSAAQKAADVLSLPQVREVLIDADRFQVLIRPVGERFTIVAILNGGSNLGLARLLIQSSSDDLRIAMDAA